VFSGLAVALVRVEVGEDMFPNSLPEFEKTRVENQKLEFESKKKAVQRKSCRGDDVPFSA
jgi:hypothetical protein